MNVSVKFTRLICLASALFLNGITAGYAQFTKLSINTDVNILASDNHKYNAIIDEQAVSQAYRQEDTDSKIPESAKKDFNFLIVGDWGRNGAFHQQDVSNQMNTYSAAYNARFIISTGDNIYDNGVKGVNDKLWKTSFEDIYSGTALQKDWFVTLGNHDYRGLAQAEVDYTKVSKRWKLPARYYAITRSVSGKDSALFVFIDTSPFVHKYHEESGQYGDIDAQDTTAQLKWIDSTLRKSNARWKMVFGHHPVYSAGTKHGGTPELLNSLNPILEKNKVEFFFCGHDHDLQHLKPAASAVDYIVSGAGSETRDAGFIDGLSKFSNGDSGFAMVSLKPDQASVYLISYTGQMLYQMNKKP